VSLDMSHEDRLWPFIRLILRRAQARTLQEMQSLHGARARRMGGPWFETPRTRARNLGKPKLAAPHHEAGRDRVCIPRNTVGRRRGLIFGSCCSQTIGSLRLAQRVFDEVE